MNDNLHWNKQILHYETTEPAQILSKLLPSLDKESTDTFQTEQLGNHDSQISKILFQKLTFDY